MTAIGRTLIDPAPAVNEASALRRYEYSRVCPTGELHTRVHLTVYRYVVLFTRLSDVSHAQAVVEKLAAGRVS